jgi:hypothetical protein
LNSIDKHIKDQILYYPPGSGGHWLMHVFYCLITNSNKNHNAINYHTSKIIPLLDDDHWNYKIKTNAIAIDDYCVFNFYINFIEKYIFDNIIGVENQFKSSYQVLEKIFFWKENVKPSNTVRYIDLWENPNNFKLSFKEMFDSIDVDIADFNNKQTIFDYKIQEFKLTVADPKKYYRQQDNIFWLVWCCFLLIHYKILPKEHVALCNGTEYIDFKKIEVQEIVDQYIDQCLAITDRLIYFYPEEIQ